MADFVSQTKQGRDASGAFTLAVGEFGQVIGWFDSLKPGPLEKIAARFAGVEKVIGDFEACARLERAPLPAGQAAAWRATLRSQADEVFKIYGVQWQAFAFSGGSAADVAQSQVSESAILRSVLKANDPKLLARVDTAVATREANDPVLRERRLARQAVERDQQLAQQAVERRAAALRAMPAAVGPWRRTSAYTYTRQGPAGVSVDLSCGDDLGKGLVMDFRRKGGDFVGGYGDDKVADTNLTQVRLNVDGVSYDARALLHRIETRRHDGPKGEDVNVYDTHRVFFSMQSPAGMGASFQRKMTNIGQATDSAVTSLTGVSGSPYGAFLGLFGDLGAVGVSAAIWNIDIAKVRYARSAKLAITVSGAGGATWVDLFDLAPQSPPFSNLMTACHG